MNNDPANLTTFDNIRDFNDPASRKSFATTPTLLLFIWRCFDQVQNPRDFLMGCFPQVGQCRDGERVTAKTSQKVTRSSMAEDME